MSSRRFFLTFSLFLLAASSVWAQTSAAVAALRWADSLMSCLSDEQKVGQLMMVRVPTHMSHKQRRAFERLVTHNDLGGVCFFAGTAQSQIEEVERLRRQTDLPLLVALDAEWGVGMRLTDGYSFPRQMLMGALPPAYDTLIEQMGAEVAAQCRAVGVHVNFAPVVDLNSNPANPVIGVRSFGENRQRTADKGIRYMRGLQRHGVMAVAKHFPGHGDTDVDSHLDLPRIAHTAAYIDSVDLYPFRALMGAGVAGVMLGHLQVDALDSRPHRPSSLSAAVADTLLRQRMGFAGLAFTDGMDMKAITKNYSAGSAAVEALMAGSDVLLLPGQVEQAVSALVDRMRTDSVALRRVNESCRRVLAAKYRYVLTEQSVLVPPSAADRQRCADLTRRMAQHAATLVRNRDALLPLPSDSGVVHLTLGVRRGALTSLTPALRATVGEAAAVVLHLYTNINPGKGATYGLEASTAALVDTLASLNPRTALVVYGPPYALVHWPKESDGGPAAIVVAYQNREEVREVVPPLLLGRHPFEGLLPVSVAGYGEGWRAGEERPQESVDPYRQLVEAGMDTACFRQIDSIALRGIALQAYPGCQLLVAKGGRVVYQRAYGRQTYDPASPAVDENTVYDLASLTKVTATTLAVMKLVDAGKVRLDDKLSRYLPYLKHTNKSRITVRQALSHYARLKAFDDYWRRAGASCGDLALEWDDETAWDDSCAACREAVLRQIAASPLNKERKYLYSDLGFILLADMVQKVSGQSLDLFVAQQFYEPMGMTSTTFCPLRHGIDSLRVAPTERDEAFRHRLLRGEVHDPNAAAMGGVAGHAGLFSTASDLARLYFMMLDSGRFDGRQLLSPEVIETFCSRHYASQGNRRALGYDKPLFHPRRGGNTAPEVSQSSYGHTGFTGTMVWVDPQHELVYIFLSNRVHPSASPNRLSQLNIRTDIQSLIYQSFLNQN